MSNILSLMLRIWEMGSMDWLGFDSTDRYSFHHIQKKSDGGKTIISNGAVLHQNSSHPYLHTIEYYDLDKYVFLNKMLKQINDQKHMPTKEQLEQIRYVLLEFQREYEGKQSGRGKDIIKKEYRIDG